MDMVSEFFQTSETTNIFKFSTKAESSISANARQRAASSPNVSSSLASSPEVQSHFESRSERNEAYIRHQYDKNKERDTQDFQAITQEGDNQIKGIQGSHRSEN